MGDEELFKLAGESEKLLTDRRFAKQKKQLLEAALSTCRRHMTRQPRAQEGVSDGVVTNGGSETGAGAVHTAVAQDMPRGALAVSYQSAPSTKVSSSDNPYGGSSGAKAGFASGLFGASSNPTASSGGGLFGASPTSNPSPGSLVTNPPNSKTSSGGNPFGASSTANSGGNLFGQSSFWNGTSGGGLFGSRPPVQTQVALPTSLSGLNPPSNLFANSNHTSISSGKIFAQLT